MTQIIVEKGCCHVDDIYNFVKANNAKMLKGRDGPSSDCRRAVLASLSKNIRTAPLFWVRLQRLASSTDIHADNSQRADESHHGWWKLGRCNPFFSEELNSRADEVMATVAIDEDDDEDEEMLEGEENGLGGELDGLAGVITEALADIGGEGTVETIVEAVSVQWNQEDDCQTVVEAFFAAGDHVLFKLDPKQEGVWLLTKQGRAHVAEMAASSPDESEEEADSSDPAGDPMEVDEDVNGDRDEREEAEAGKSSGRVKREKSPSKPRIQRVTRSRVKTSDSSRGDKRNASSTGSASPAGQAGAYPTQLQERIKDLIVDSGGSCNGDFIINTITEESNTMTFQAKRELLGTDEDARKVVTMVLTAPKKPADQLFKRDVNSDGSWMLSRKGLRAWVRSPAKGGGAARHSMANLHAARRPAYVQHSFDGHAGGDRPDHRLERWPGEHQVHPQRSAQEHNQDAEARGWHRLRQGHSHLPHHFDEQRQAHVQEGEQQRGRLEGGRQDGAGGRAAALRQRAQQEAVQVAVACCPLCKAQKAVIRNEAAPAAVVWYSRSDQQVRALCAAQHTPAAGQAHHPLHDEAVEGRHEVRHRVAFGAIGHVDHLRVELLVRGQRVKDDVADAPDLVAVEEVETLCEEHEGHLSVVEPRPRPRHLVPWCVAAHVRQGEAKQSMSASTYSATVTQEMFSVLKRLRTRT